MTLPRPASLRIGLAPAEPRGRAEPPNDAGFLFAFSNQLSAFRFQKSDISIHQSLMF